MSVINIKKGLDLPINGEPSTQVNLTKDVKKIALLGNDYIGLKPTMAVNEGDTVKLGQLLFTDKKMAGVKFTSPGAGKVVEINRGEKRKFLSIVIELSGDEEVTFNSYEEAKIIFIDREEVKQQLLDSGVWISLRERPFSKVADPEHSPSNIFVTAIDSNPNAPSLEKILKSKENSFKNGLRIVSKLTDGKVFLCKEKGSNIPEVELNNLLTKEFSGVHPKGLAGTHIHFLSPVGRNRKVWYINAQDVAMIGDLFTTGKINVERTVAITGPSVKKPGYIKTRIGASLFDLTENEIADGEQRIISGSVLSGRKATKEEAYLGRYHQQVTAIEEATQRDFLGWVVPSSKLFSIKKVLLSSLTPDKKFNFTSTLNGGKRAIVPNGSYEEVMPLDILPTFLLRSLAVNDVEESEKLGCLELDEEDLALCTYVCPSKIDHGNNLRRNLTLIDKEG
ncbi:MAG: NADH:ubiquinone reductase (Na(+)-transporting) subunit A [Ignavibacteriae bacterium]|nr:MAG: NADH:ubiquinone reductase (Na(+)-transporting) subunit A [Ignavibacteriota bacterium]